jgi:hypothetical protein
MAVVLAFVFMGSDFLPVLGRWKAALTPSSPPSFLLGLLIYPVVIALLAWFPVRHIVGTRGASRR